MSNTRKRALAGESETDTSKEPKEKKSVSSARPPKPVAKRRKTTDNDSNKVLEAKPSSGKSKRQIWSKTACDTFFEGLSQHGKEFHKILKFMQSKQKKDPTIGNLTKDQVRFFYYRNWRKVEQLLQVPAQHNSTDNKRSASSKALPHTNESNEDSSTEEAAQNVSEDSQIVSNEDTQAVPSEATTPMETGGAMEDKTTPEEVPPGENDLDSSTEEVEPSSPTNTTEVKSSPPPADRGSTVEKNKEQVHASPGGSDKTEGKVKDTVLVNGNKQSLDLVALICYDKLRRGKNMTDHNIGRKLSELVFQGVTTIPSRVKGRRKTQIRIPNCGAFRAPVRKPESAITSDDPPTSTSTDKATPDSCVASEVPSLTEQGEVVVEITPLSTQTWLHVQDLSHNPRIRLKLDEGGTPSTVRDYLKLKWKLDKSQSLNFYHPKTSTQKTMPSKPVEVSNKQLNSDGIEPNNKTEETKSPDEIEAANGSEEVKATAKVVDETGGELELLEMDKTWKELAQRLVKLRYEIVKDCEPDQPEYADRLRSALKLVEFFLRKSPAENPLEQAEDTGPSTPVKTSRLITHASPKVKEYMQTLRQSPHRSPLSKYRKIRKSPLKRSITTPSRAFKRVQLSFDESSKVPSAPVTTVPTSTPTVLSTMKLGDTSQIVQVSKQNTSFINMNMNQLLPKTAPPQTTKHSITSKTRSSAQQARVSTHTTPVQSQPVLASSIVTPPILPSPVGQTQPLLGAGINIAQLIAASPVLMAGLSSSIVNPVLQTSPVTVMTSTAASIPQQSTMSHSAATPSPSIMSALAPFKKPKRAKKPPAKPGQPHQLVPRPLPFLKDLKLVNNGSPSTQVNSSLVPSANNTSLKTTAALIQLLQTYIQQQQATRHKQPSKPPKQQPINQPVQTSSKSTPSAQESIIPNTQISEKFIQNTLLDNLLTENPETSVSSGSKFVNTSSDTVNMLLRGFSVKPSESIQKLSEETSDVLPSFAKALGDSLLSSEAQGPSNELQAKAEAEQQKPKEPGASNKMEPSNEVEPSIEEKTPEIHPPSPAETQPAFLQESNTITDILGTLTDSNFKQVADNGDIFEHIDFNDMFSQLKEVMTPEKKSSIRKDEDSQSSIGNLLDYVNSDKLPSSSYHPPVEPACRTFLEEGSVDFIQKFRELASTMDGSTTN